MAVKGALDEKYCELKLLESVGFAISDFPLVSFILLRMCRKYKRAERAFLSPD
jgi:hypothetical protein